MPTPFGKYLLLRKLAEGGMAEVFLAKQKAESGFERLIVVKRILPHLTNQPEFVRMFVNEARIAARLNHANIAQIFDLGRVGHAYFMAMEYVHGEDVARVAKQCDRLGRSPLPLGAVARIVIDLCHGLHHAHEAVGQNGERLGLVHRDVSPQNVLATFDGEVKIIDFGVAKATAIAGETQAGVMKGKYAYMSPEQCRGGQIDARSDQFAVGIMLWELVAWRRLFKRDADYLTMRAVVEDQPAPITSIRRDVPPELDAILGRALAKDREQRYASCEELADALEDLARRSGWDTSPHALARLMRELFQDRLRAEERALEEAQAASIEEFLLAVDEKTKLDWMHGAPSDEDAEPTRASRPRDSLVPGAATGEAASPPTPASAVSPSPTTTTSRGAHESRLKAAPVAPLSSRWRWGAVAGVAALGLVAAGALIVTRSGNPGTGGSEPAPHVGAAAPPPAHAPPSPAPPAPALSVPPPAAPAPTPGSGPRKGSSRLVLAGQEGVSVFLDGRRRGTTPLVLEDLVPGVTYSLFLVKRGFLDRSLELAPLSPGEHRRLEVRLEPAAAPPAEGRPPW